METKNKIKLFGVVVTLFLGVGSWYFSAGGKEKNIDVYGELIENVYNADGDINIKYENRDIQTLLNNHNIEYDKLDSYPTIKKQIKRYVTFSNIVFEKRLRNPIDGLIGTEKYSLEDEQYIFINSVEQNETCIFITMYDKHFTCYCQFIYWIEDETLMIYKCSDMITEGQKKFSGMFTTMLTTWAGMFAPAYTGLEDEYKDENYAMAHFKVEDKYLFTVLKRELYDFHSNDPESVQKAQEMYERYKNTE